MNPTQRRILLVALLASLAMLLVPPHRVGVLPQRVLSEGADAGLPVVYRFVFSSGGGRTEGIAWRLLRLQLQWLALFTLVLLVLFRPRNRGGDGGAGDAAPTPDPSPILETEQVAG